MGDCIDCGKKLVRYTAIRCKSCNMKFQWTTDYWKNKIRTRDKFRCVNCLMTEQEHLRLIGKVLHIHHVDYNKLNCKEDNLVTLCTFCNSKANFNRDFWLNYYTDLLRGVSNVR